MKNILLLCSCFWLLTSCLNGDANSDVKEPVFIERDTTITPVNSVTQLLLDSARLEEYVSRKNLSERLATQLRSFYNSRNYQYAWFSEDGFTEQAQSFWNLHNQHLNLTKDSSFYDADLHLQMEEIQKGTKPDNKTIIETELQLTNHFFRFAETAYAGNLNPEELQWHIPRKKIDVLQLLDSLIKTKGKNIDEWEPVSRQYQLLKNELLRYYQIQTNNSWQLVQAKIKVLKRGDKSEALKQIKKHLHFLGDLENLDSTAKFDTTLLRAVKSFQSRMGLVATGRIDSLFLREINISPEKRIEKILINLERMRWLPMNEKEKRIVVNIPEFKLHVYEGDEEQMTMKIVVGKEGTSTVIFSDQLKYIVFSPYWNVTNNIVKNEILPAIKKNSNYLQSQNMEIYATSNGVPQIRQKPGANNALGKVKFLFPNRYNIYLHDTPSKSLFDRTKRAFSHGCIRVSEPYELASYLLQSDSTWTEERILEAMNKDKETWVSLRRPIPVYISYFTAWVDPSGQLNFREDIYGHDRKMSERMFQHTETHHE